MRNPSAGSAPRIAKFAEAVYVLHAFRKTTRKTSVHDKNLGKARYQEMIRHRRGLRKQRKGK